MSYALPTLSLLLADRFNRALFAVMYSVGVRARIMGGALSAAEQFAQRRAQALHEAFARLFQQAASGTLRATRHRAARTPSAERATASGFVEDACAGAERAADGASGDGGGGQARKAAPVRTAFGWMSGVLGVEAGPHEAEIRALLSQEALVDVLRLAPDRFSRVVRPLCWGLGLTPPDLFAAPRAFAPPAPLAPEDADEAHGAEAGWSEADAAGSPPEKAPQATPYAESEVSAGHGAAALPRVEPAPLQPEPERIPPRASAEKERPVQGGSAELRLPQPLPLRQSEWRAVSLITLRGGM